MLTNARHVRISLLLTFAYSASLAQIPVVPENAQVNLYFPHFTDGGPAAQQWQTKLTFLNPNNSTVSVVLFFYADNGGPLNLDFGSGASSQFSFSIPPGGSRVFRSKIASRTITTGWAFGAATLPVQATVSFKAIQNGNPLVEISANPTLPTNQYVSPATPSLGVALVNSYTNQPVSVVLGAYDSNGTSVAQKTLTIAANGHVSFNLGQTLPNLTADFTGMLVLKGSSPADNFIAWTVGADSGTLASLPDGRYLSTTSQWDRIWLAYSRVLNAATALVNLGTEPISLQISSDPVIQAFGGASGIQINLALAELISDSPSELAFAIGHELGHVYQRRSGRAFLFPGNVEVDADAFGTFAAVLGGYDPYAAAGTLAKFYMATGTAGLITQFENQLAPDAHKSFNSRLETIFDTINAVCSLSQQTKTACNNYKYAAHPHFPPAAPLAVPNPSQ